MLRKIRSKYITKNIFSYINEKTKLNLIKFNKKLQKELFIKIINYQILSGRYIEYETNDTIKEYNAYNDLLIYEGEFKEGKRNGKGKEYNNEGKLIYEGEYLNGIVNGKGKKFNNGILMFEGEYLNGLVNGKGKEYDIDNNIMFEGEYLNGIRWNGKGKDYDINNNIIFEGEYLKGNRWNGKIYDISNNNIMIELKEGKGLINYFYENKKIKFKGEYLNGKIYKSKVSNDLDILFIENELLNEQEWNKIKYEYDYKNNKELDESYKKGLIFKVKEYGNNNEIIYEGLKLEGNRWNGKGKEYYNNGKVKFEGDYLNKKKWNGKEYDINDEDIYEIKNGNGFIKEYDYRGNLLFEGNYLNGERNGKGKEYENNELIFEGEYLN